MLEPLTFTVKPTTLSEFQLRHCPPAEAAAFKRQGWGAEPNRSIIPKDFADYGQRCDLAVLGYFSADYRPPVVLEAFFFFVPDAWDGKQLKSAEKHTFKLNASPERIALAKSWILPSDLDQLESEEARNKWQLDNPASTEQWKQGRIDDAYASLSLDRQLEYKRLAAQATGTNGVRFEFYNEMVDALDDAVVTVYKRRADA